MPVLSPFRPVLLLLLFGDRIRVVLGRLMPEVWSAPSPVPDAPPPPAPPALDRFPSRSVSPPSADRLVSAFRAPGLDSSWANGMADASGLPAAAEPAPDPPLEPADPPPPAPPLAPPATSRALPAEPVPAPAAAAAAADSSPKFAFCSSTLFGGRREKGGEEREREREKEEVVRLGLRLRERERKDGGFRFQWVARTDGRKGRTRFVGRLAGILNGGISEGEVKCTSQTDIYTRVVREECESVRVMCVCV